MREDGRPNHIEDALVKMHSRQWFTWTDSKNKIYAEVTDNIGKQVIDNIEINVKV